MAGLVCHLGHRIAHFQGMRAEVVPELVRGNPVRTLIEKTVHTAAVELSAIPADKQVLRLGISYLQVLTNCMDDLVIDEYDPLLIAFSSHQQFPCLKINICQADADALADTQAGICKDHSYRIVSLPGINKYLLSYLYPPDLQSPAGISADPLP